MVAVTVQPRRIRAPGSGASLVLGVLLSAMVLVPVAMVTWRLADSGGSLLAVKDIIASSVYQWAFVRTAVIGVSAAAASTVLATGLAWLTHRTDLPLRRVFAALVIVPFFIPLVVTAIAWTLLSAESSGLVNRALEALDIPFVLDVYNVGGIVFVLALSLTPAAYFFVRDAIAEPATEQEEAAIVSGASAFLVSLRMTLPRIMPSLGATFLIVLVLAAANFSAPAVLGLSRRIDVLSTQIYVAMNSYPVSYTRVATVALTLVILLLGLLFQQQRLERRAHASSQHVIRTEPIVWQLGIWKWPLFLVVCTYFCLALVLPFGAIVLTSLLPYAGAELDQVSLKNFVRLFDSTVFQVSIVNTIIFASIGATIAVAVGSLAAYMFRRLRPPGAAIWDIIASAPIALPGIVIGLGYLWVAVGSPIYGTLTLTTAVVIVRFIPFALRSGTAALTRVDRGLDEASRIAGATEIDVFWRIVLPNIRTSIISMWGLLFILFSHEIDTNVLLQGTNNGVLAVQIYSWYQYGGPELAAAGSVILLGMTAAVLCIIALLVRGHRAAFGPGGSA